MSASTRIVPRHGVAFVLRLFWRQKPRRVVTFAPPAQVNPSGQGAQVLMSMPLLSKLK